MPEAYLINRGAIGFEKNETSKKASEPLPPPHPPPGVGWVGVGGGWGGWEGYDVFFDVSFFSKISGGWLVIGWWWLVVVGCGWLWLAVGLLTGSVVDGRVLY